MRPRNCKNVKRCWYIDRKAISYLSQWFCSLQKWSLVASAVTWYRIGRKSRPVTPQCPDTDMRQCCWPSSSLTSYGVIIDEEFDSVIMDFKFDMVIFAHITWRESLRSQSGRFIIKSSHCNWFYNRVHLLVPNRLMSLKSCRRCENNMNK